VRRGSLCWVNLGTSTPPEFGKTRPAVLVSNSVQNELLDSVVVVPLSTVPGEIWPLRIRADDVRGANSCAVLPGIRQVSKTRLVEFIGPASTDFLRRLDEALARYLND
jgi:mRNA interferase MazF